MKAIFNDKMKILNKKIFLANFIRTYKEYCE